jgi:sulfate permease, SulP family
LNLGVLFRRKVLRSRPEDVHYGWSELLGDLSGGVIAALIALPYGLAMASLMGLPPVLGIFTSILTAPFIALLGRNPVLIGGTASATVPFIALASRSQGVGGAAKVAIVSSVFMMGFALLRWGRHIMKVPHAVVSGFSCGIGALMLISQSDVILGVQSPLTSARGPYVYFGQLVAVLRHIGETRWVPLVLGLTVIVAADLAGRWSPRAPAPLIGVALALAIAQIFGFHENVVGRLPRGLPDFVGFSWSPRDVFTVLPSAFGLAFVSAVNILMTSRVVEHFRGRHKRMKTSDADAELGAYGIANVVGGLFGAPPSVGIPARSLAVVRCGGTTRLSNLFHGIILAAVLWVSTGVVAQIPLAALAGVTAWMGIGLLNWSAWKRLPKMSRTDAAAFLSTAAIVLINAVLAVAVGCAFYVLRALYLKLTRPERPAPPGGSEVLETPPAVAAAGQ